jgi:hypothetical protein
MRRWSMTIVLAIELLVPQYALLICPSRLSEGEDVSPLFARMSILLATKRVLGSCRLGGHPIGSLGGL